MVEGGLGLIPASHRGDTCKLLSSCKVLHQKDPRVVGTLVEDPTVRSQAFHLFDSSTNQDTLALFSTSLPVLLLTLTAHSIERQIQTLTSSVHPRETQYSSASGEVQYADSMSHIAPS